MQARCRRQRCEARGAARTRGVRSASSSWRRTRTPSASAIACISTTAPPATARTAHGNQAVGAPDLTDADWLYGGDGETILTSILDGRNGVMPPLGTALGHNGVNEVAVYVVSLSGTRRRRTGSRPARCASIRFASPVTARMAAATRRWAHPICPTTSGSMAATSPASWPACATGATASCRPGVAAHQR